MTSFRARSRTRQLIVFVAVVQLVLGGLEGFVGPMPRLVVWWGAALVVGVATNRIENFFARRGRILP